MRVFTLVAVATSLGLAEGVATELCDGVSCEDSEWIGESSFIQQSLQIARREDILENSQPDPFTLTAVQTVITPSTADVDLEAFGERVAVFPFWVVAALLAFTALVVLHEFFVHQGMCPLLAQNPYALELGCQALCLWMQMWAFMQMSMTIPLSLDFALSLRHGGAASGFYVSAGILMGVVGTCLGKSLVDEMNWKQSYSRRIMVVSHVLTGVANLCLALFMNATVQSNQVYLIWWTCILLGQVSVFTTFVPNIPSMIFWSKITQPENRTFWTTLHQCSRNLGLVLGPLIYALVSAGVSSGKPRVDPRSMMALVHMLLVFLALALALFTALLLPTQLPERRVAMPQAQPARSRLLAGEASPEDLDDADRARMVWNQVVYALERSFTLAAVEVSTVMMLEVFYGWDPYYNGICFTVVCSLGIAATMLILGLLQLGYLQESTLFMATAASAIFGCTLLFDEGHAKAWTLLAADSLIYTGSTVANGLSMGWATRAAKEGTSFSQGDFQLQSMIAVSAARFMAPIMGRLLVDVGGRNAYASIQLVVCCLGTRTAYRSCCLLWARKDAQMPTRQETTNCALIAPRKNPLHAPEDSPNPSEASPFPVP